MDGNVRKASIGFVILVALVCFACTKDQPESRLITVTGDAEVRVVPDEVMLTFGVETWDKHLTVAKQQNDECVKRILALAKKYGIESEKVQTDHISIEPRYKDGYQRSNFIGYFVRKTVVLTLKDISKFEGLFSSALEAGANYVHGVEFRTTKLRKYRDQARALAIKAAKEKAKDLAKELGQRIGKPQSISEEHSGWWYWYNGWWGTRWERGGGMAQNVVQNISESSVENEGGIALGQISVTARVKVSFMLK